MATTSGDIQDDARRDVQLTELVRFPYVRLTTFRRDGRSVATPVWVVADSSALGGRDGDLLVTTEAETGKVKRLRHTPRVLLAACSARGRVLEGAVEVEARAEVLTDPAAVARVLHLITLKHPVGSRTLGAVGAATSRLRRLRRRPEAERVVLRIYAA